MTAILDQKHYIEELNRHLSGTVTDLQAKMDSLEKTNSKLVEEVRCVLCVTRSALGFEPRLTAVVFMSSRVIPPSSVLIALS